MGQVNAAGVPKKLEEALGAGNRLSWLWVRGKYYLMEAIPGSRRKQIRSVAAGRDMHSAILMAMRLLAQHGCDTRASLVRAIRENVSSLRAWAGFLTRQVRSEKSAAKDAATKTEGEDQ
jgi:hypothetical protein